MSELPQERQLLIFNQGDPLFPNSDYSTTLTLNARGHLATLLGTFAALASQVQTAESLFNLSWAGNLLGDDSSDNQRRQRAQEEWLRAQAQPDYSFALEQEVARDWVDRLIRINEPGLAWQPWRYAAGMTRSEPLERQGYTAYKGSEIAEAQGKDKLQAEFLADANALWKQAIAAGQQVDRRLFTETKQAPDRPPTASLNTLHLMTYAAQIAANHAARTIYPSSAGDGARGGVI